MDLRNLEQSINYLIKEEDIYYIKMMPLFNKMAQDYIYFMSKYPDILDLDEEFKNKVSYIETLKHTTKFIKNININYYRIFRQLYKSGNIHFDFSEDGEAFSDIIDDTKRINFPITYSIDDSFCLVHEFKHYLNLDKNISIARDYLTESFSILFEFLLSDYYEKNNYHNKEFLNVKLLRFVNCYANACSLYNDDIVDIYLKNGTLDSDTIKKYYSNNLELINQTKLECDKYSEECLPFFENKKYLLGILLTCDIHQRLLEEPKYIEKIFYLIENINNMQLSECLKILNINLNYNNGSFEMNDRDYHRLFSNLEKEFIDVYKKYKGVINEESNCNSRTDRSR